MKLINNIKRILKVYIFNERIENIKKNDKKVFIMMAADYGNIGDIAITIAQRDFLKENLEGYNVIEIPLRDVYKKILSIKKMLNPNDVITIIGGGNTTDLYQDFEDARRYIIKKLKKSNVKIISFPQTISFTDTKKGNKELKKSAKIYQKANKQLYIFAREEKSYNIYKKYFKNMNIKLVPDIVLSMNKEKNASERKNILICLRNDCEKVVDSGQCENLIEKIKKKYKNIIFQDTHIGEIKIEGDNKEKYLNKILNEFSKAKIVLTDRLHGMIFCAITNTKCIALNNSNGKIKETYKKWLSENPNIIFMDNIDEKEIIDKINDNNLEKEDMNKFYEKMNKNFKPLIDVLKIN